MRRWGFLTLALVAFLGAVSAWQGSTAKPVHRIPGPAVVPATLDIKALAAVGERAKSWAPRDSFSAAPDWAEIVGKTVHISLPVGEWTPAAAWSYDASARKLTITLNARHFGSRELGRDIPEGATYSGITVLENTKAGAPYIATNAFGASVAVQVLGVADLGLANPDGRGGVGPLRDLSYPATRELTMDAATARAYVAGLRVRIDGVVEPFRDGRAVLCGRSRVKPTFDDPSETKTWTCVVGMKPSTVQVVDAKGLVVIDAAD